MAEDCGITTTLPPASSQPLHKLLSRRFRRLRSTAVPRNFLTTKTTPDSSRPWRIQRAPPLIHGARDLGLDCRDTGQTVRRLRPLRRRRLMIARPPGVRILLRKPCLFRRFLLLG
jgi:hypothetical protein